MRSLALVLLLSSLVFSEFSVLPYLYKNESASDVTYATFLFNSSNARLVKIKGEIALVVLDERMVSDREQIKEILSHYFMSEHYPTQEELSSLKGYADAFNKSRNAQTKYGPAEKVCYSSATFLAYKPCNDVPSCMQTASLVCSLSGADGCVIDVLASHILAYKKSIDKLNSAYQKFSDAYSSFSPATAATSLSAMDEAFALMKEGADEIMDSKLRFPEKRPCRDCLGICPEGNFDYQAISQARSKIAQLKEKIAPLVFLEGTIDKVALSSQSRANFRMGEEKAALLLPRYQPVKSRYGGLMAKAVEAKALVSDQDFVAVADSFIKSGEALEKMFSTRNFSGFEAALSSFESSGMRLSEMLENATSAYMIAKESEDEAGDYLIMAKWRTSRLSPKSIEAYGMLAERKSALSSKLSPPMTSEEYLALSEEFKALSQDIRAYIASSSKLHEPVFSVGSAFSRISVDGAMAIAGSIAPISFKSRQSFAKFVPPLLVFGVDIILLIAAIALFIFAFLHFKRAFRSKLVASGWILSLLALAFLIVFGSAAFYSIFMSVEKFTSFEDFMGTVRASNKAAIIVEKSDAPLLAAESMEKCARDIAAQLEKIGKISQIYSIRNERCVPLSAESMEELSAEECLNSLPDIPVFSLKYAEETEEPVFTTVAAKQAMIAGNQSYYSAQPMCEIANVLD